MTAFIIERGIRIVRQGGSAGNQGIVITIPEIISLNDKTIDFQVWTKGRGRLIFEKPDEEWKRDGQTISCRLNLEDMQNKAGTHEWELQVKEGSLTIIKVMNGEFVIRKDLIRNGEEEDA
jgi:hypothetical protein